MKRECEDDFMKKDVLQKSIILSGPAGAGKSLLAEELSKRMGYPVVCTDLLRNFPTDEELQAKKYANLTGKAALETKRQAQLWQVLNDQQMKGLQHFYLRRGYSPTIAKQMDQMYGALGWHYYQKFYETELLKNVIAQLKKPVILDLGAGMTICLEKEYAKIKDDLLKQDPNFFKLAFPNDDKINLWNIQKLLRDFRNVVYLKLPDDYKDKMVMAAGDILNKHFLASGQYEFTKHFTINVDGLVQGMNRNRAKAKQLANEIVTKIGERDEILSRK